MAGSEHKGNSGSSRAFSLRVDVHSNKVNWRNKFPRIMDERHRPRNLGSQALTIDVVASIGSVMSRFSQSISGDAISDRV